MIRCDACVNPEGCKVLGACANVGHYADMARQLKTATKSTPVVNTTAPKEEKKKSLDKTTRRPDSRVMDKTTAARIADDLAFARENSQEFEVGNGRVSQTRIIRYVVALNPDVNKRDFIAALVDLGFHPNTAAIQFANSRRESLECGDVRLLPDGRLEDL